MSTRCTLRPYGWPELEVILLLARLLVLGEISLIMDGAIIPLDKVYDAVTTPSRRRRITVMQRKTSDPKALQNARNLGKDVFSEMGPDGEDALFTFLGSKLEGWRTNLLGYKTLADTGNYPGQEEINDSLTLIKALVAFDESYKFIERFNARKDDLQDLSDNYHDLENFYEHQRPTWEKLRRAYHKYNLNRSQLEQDGKAAPALRRMHEILSAKSPYGLIKEAEGLITTVEGVNSTLVTEHRTKTTDKIDAYIRAITKDIEAANGDAALRSRCLGPLEKLRSQVDRQESIAHITQAEYEAIHQFDTVQEPIAAYLRETSGDKPVVKKVRPVKPASLVQTTYLETKEDVDHFLGALKQELYEAIDQEERIQIR